MSSASEVLGGLTYSKEPSGWVGADGTNAFCFRDELWRLKGWPFEEGPEWARFPDAIGSPDLEAVIERAELVPYRFDEPDVRKRLYDALHPGLAMFLLRGRADGVVVAHVEYAFSVPLIVRYWDTPELPPGSPAWPLRQSYWEHFDVRLDAVLVDVTQTARLPEHPRYIPRGSAALG